MAVLEVARGLWFETFLFVGGEIWPAGKFRCPAIPTSIIICYSQASLGRDAFSTSLTLVGNLRFLFVLYDALIMYGTRAQRVRKQVPGLKAES